MNLFENLQLIKEDENTELQNNELNEVSVYETNIIINNLNLAVNITESETYINCYIDDKLFLQEPKEYVDDLEYFAFNSAVEFYKGLKFPNAEE